ncbi:D-alanine--D-alanine ligase [Proteobacteria bacterium 005FR1]|nr:D-alanine--D-alanine ligase [Proteobacteria bacterium 005FR1]
MNESGSKKVTVPVSEELRQQLGRVAVLFGGDSAEREVSLQSGTAVLNALLAANVDAVGIDTGKDALKYLQKVDVDRAFIMLHGAGGENGSMQALLTYLDIPYTGSGVGASALAMDKLRSKQLWLGMNLPTAKFAVLSDKSDWQQLISDLNGGAMVKPAHEGSSLGMSRAGSAEELKAAYEKARQYDSSVIAEALIRGPEYTVSILNDQVLPPIRLEANNVFYDYEAKYISNETRYHCPCGLSAEKEAQLKQLALDAYNSLGCEGWGRVDVMADEAGNFFVLEVNTVPGMTSHSLVPMAAKAAGLSFEELVVTILLSKFDKDR